MTPSLLQFAVSKLSSGLARSGIQKCSEYSEKYRVMGKPFPGLWTFKHHPWLKTVCDDPAELVVVQKGAQLGLTELGINKVFFEIDINGNNCVYVLPTDGDASDFSASRFDPAIQLSSHLSNLFTDVANVGHKRAGSASLFIRGSRSRNKLKSVPASLIVFDEVDEMDKNNIAMAMERSAGQPIHQNFMLSNPTIENRGINKYYQNSTQSDFFFKCPHCNRYISLWLDNLIITADNPNDPKINDSHIICKECKQKLAHEEKINFMQRWNWVKKYQDRDVTGYTLNQLYSMTKRPDQIAKQVILARTDQVEEQNLYNQVLGTVHCVSDAKITDTHLIDVTSDYIMGFSRKANKIITMGIDVGPKFLHIEIDEWTIDLRYGLRDINNLARCKVLFAGTRTHFEDIDVLAIEYGVQFTVVDANPERRKAYELCERLELARACFYGNSVAGKLINDSETTRTVTVDRTSWLDLSLGRFFKGKSQIEIPRDIPNDYKEHVKNLVKVPKRRKESNDPTKRSSLGQNVNEYLDTGDDHFAHARNYSEIALRLAVGGAANEDIPT